MSHTDPKKLTTYDIAHEALELLEGNYIADVEDSHRNVIVLNKATLFRLFEILQELAWREKLKLIKLTEDT